MRTFSGNQESFYNRNARVINPPVDFNDFPIFEKPTNDYYLVLGQLVPYKKADLVVNAFKLSGRKLKIVGEGPQFSMLSKLANDNIEILGRQPFDVIKELLANCRALIFPGVEDFGIVPLEAMSCGRPVIAYRAGGALETVKEGLTGVFFDVQSEQSLNQTIDVFEKNSADFDPTEIRKWSENFSKEQFKQKFAAYVSHVMSEYIK